MEELTNNNKRPHKVILSGRKNCTINGVNDVLAFDNHEILLETEMGVLMVKGNEMHVGRLSLDKGEVDIDGSIDSLTYSEQSIKMDKNESLFTRLFK